MDRTVPKEKARLECEKHALSPQNWPTEPVASLGNDADSTAAAYQQFAGGFYGIEVGDDEP